MAPVVPYRVAPSGIAGAFASSPPCRNIQSSSVVRFAVTISHPRNFACPECQACYKVVRMRTEPGASYPTLQCIVCYEPLAATEGDSILKYFLVGRPKRA
jgi:hypothetical protein